MLRRRQKPGFTMIELLVAVAIVAILILVFLFLSRGQKSKADDARRKADLEEIKISFEDYFNDNECYPPAGTLDNCNSDSFSPYLRRIPCDPVSREPYAYEPEANCSGYRLYTDLDYNRDPVIAKLGCDGPEGCGAAAGIDYNYGISVGVGLIGSGPVAQPSPTPSPSPSVLPSPSGSFVYACDSGGSCNEYSVDNPILLTCPVTYPDTLCSGQCGNVNNRCGS